MAVTDPLDQLRKLAALKAEGIVDDAEFSRLKAELLSQVSGGAAVAQANSVESPPLAAVVSSSPGQPIVESLKITPQQVHELGDRFQQADAEYQQLAAQQRTFWGQLRRSRRRLKYNTFRLIWRRPLKNVHLGPLGPIIVLPALGILLGTMFFGLFTSSTNVMLGFGVLTGLAVFILAVNFFALPADAKIQSQSDFLSAAIAGTQSQLSQLEPLVSRKKEMRETLHREYRAMVAQFKTRRNALLLMDWRTLRGIPFELFLRDVLMQLDFRVTMTKASGDQGIDLIAEKNDLKIAVQAKGYAESVGNAAIQQAHTGMSYYGCNHCVVITNSTFTAAAHQLAEKVRCILVDGSQIESLIMGRVKLV